MIVEGSRRWSSKKAKVAFDRICEILAENNEDAVLADGYEDALVGVAYTFGRDPVALYDRAKCIEILVKADGMTNDEAEEFFEFNTIGAGVDHAPVFATIAREAFRNHKIK